MSSTDRSEALDIGLPVPIEIRPMRTARRLRLRFDEATGTLKLTCPARTSRRAALAWALDQSDWIEAQLERAAPAEPFVDGAWIPIEGVNRRLHWSAAHSRTPALVDGELRCGGPQDGVSRRIERFLKALALARMSDDVAEFAAKADVPVRSVAIGDAASRWGSCSSDGRIRLSWRLIFAPPNVRRYVVAHEVAHLKHMNHGKRFWGVVNQLTPHAEAAIPWLRAEGFRLLRIG